MCCDLIDDDISCNLKPQNPFSVIFDAVLRAFLFFEVTIFVHKSWSEICVLLYDVSNIHMPNNLTFSVHV